MEYSEDTLLSNVKIKVKGYHMVLAEFTISPTGEGESLSRFVAPVIDIIDRSGLNYQLTPMGTIVEGTWEEVMTLITDCFRQMQAECSRIGVSIKVDYRKGSETRMKSKIEKVESLIGRSVRQS